MLLIIVSKLLLILSIIRKEVNKKMKSQQKAERICRPEYSFEELLEIILCIWNDPQNDGDAVGALYKYVVGFREHLLNYIKENKSKQ